MRNLITCDARLQPSAVAATFEEAMLQDVLPNAGDDGSLPPGTLFVRSLYRAAGDGFPPEYRCLVITTLGCNGGFFGMRRRMHLLGAEIDEPQTRPLAGALPDDETALRKLGSRTLVTLTVRIPLRLIQEEFEKELLAALGGEVGVATRVNNVTAALWTRDDTVVSGRVEYQVAAFGAFLRPQLRDDTLKQIRTAGGDVVESRVFHHVGTVAGDEPTPTATAG
ncbi:hypothetical protein ACTMSW_26185 [Micromonospora sp. BQ11]|uniref:hypothetical protein n=1 Tax=Micromonospora sp. BQ11 TaxID=3452212 RepID=UPI003F8A5434